MPTSQAPLSLFLSSTAIDMPMAMDDITHYTTITHTHTRYTYTYTHTHVHTHTHTHTVYTRSEHTHKRTNAERATARRPLIKVEAAVIGVIALKIVVTSLYVTPSVDPSDGAETPACIPPPHSGLTRLPIKHVS